jgi:hypothetical protein
MGGGGAEGGWWCMEVTGVLADNTELGDGAQRARWERQRQRRRRGQVAQSGWSVQTLDARV